MRNKGFEVRTDTCFEDVVSFCSRPRKGESGTWLGPAMRKAYLALHRAGHARSFETWREGELVGGLYGVEIGRMFYGESMFSTETDASKVALVGLVEELRRRQMPLIDCQQRTPLLASLGGREIPRREFLRRVTALVN
jgi:leucyl/phenylalanyl-tRNA--protein transferase